MQTLVIGATGKVGSAVVRHLAEAGRPIVAAVRSVKSAREQFEEQSAIAFRPFDYEQPASFGPALRGIDAVFFIGPPGAEVVTPMERFFREARMAGVQRLIFNSGRTTGDIPGKPLYQIEQMLPQCGIDYAILRPGWFMQNFSTWLAEDIRKENAIHLPLGDAKTAFVDVRDIAAVTEALIYGPPLSGNTYELVSDEALDHYEVAEALSHQLGRTITFYEHSPVSYTNRMLQKGWKLPAIEHTIFLYNIVKTGKEAELSPDIQEFTGHRPTRLEEFISDHLPVWKK